MTRMHRTSCWWLTCGVVALTVTLSAAAAPAVPSHNPLELTSQGADASSSSRSASSRPRKLLQDTSTTTSSSSSSSSSGPCVGSPQQPVPPQQQGQPSSVNTPALAGAAAAGPSPATDPSTTGKVLPGIGDPPVHLNTLLVVLPVLGMVFVLTAMLLCLHTWLRRAYPGGAAAHIGDTWDDSFTPTGYPFVRPVSLVQVESELIPQSGSHGSAGGGHPLSSSGMRVRSLPEMVLMWQQHLQGGTTTVRSSASFPTVAHHQRRSSRTSFGSASSSTIRLDRSSSLPEAVPQRQHSNQLQRLDSAALARQQRLSAAASVGEQVFALLAPDVADLRQNYLSVCHGLTAFDQISPARGPRRADRIADRERLLQAKRQLQSQLQEVQLQVQGRALVTWQDVEVCWGIWQALDDAGVTNPVIASRQRRFPGLAPWLIAELPTWVHTPPAATTAPAPAGAETSSPAEEPAAATAAGGELPTADSAPAAAVTSSSSSHAAAPDAELEIVSASASPRLHVRTAPGGTLDPSKVWPPSNRAQQAAQAPAGQVAWVVQGGASVDDDTEDSPCCAVCLDEMAAGDLLQRLPPCGHTLHAPCLASWLANSATCPVCRTVALPRAII